ncbi:MAG: MBL fold metallo-hydrolase, partial [Acidobacteriota bacterium]|nr:MBL fold metallo-hydrolase [Acidobacteriota bacterium]
MDNVDLVWSDAAAEVHRFVVGPLANNVYVVRCRRSGQATLIDAANEHERLLRVARGLGVASVLETHGHWDHIGAVNEVRLAGID